jgi:alpha-glucosidase
VLSNHDVTRPATRYGRADTSFGFDRKAWGIPTDLALGLRRARAAALLVAALPGSLYLYQGDELGLPEVEDLHRGELQDPMYFRSQGENPGRDGCRVPLPWSGDHPPFGFSPASGAAPWLTQPSTWSALTVDAQEHDPHSTLNLYRRSLRIRRDEPDLRRTNFAWIDAGPDVLAFRRGEFLSLTNFGDAPVTFGDEWELVLSSEALDGREIPRDITVWARRP